MIAKKANQLKKILNILEQEKGSALKSEDRARYGSYFGELMPYFEFGLNPFFRYYEDKNGEGVFLIPTFSHQESGINNLRYQKIEAVKFHEWKGSIFSKEDFEVEPNKVEDLCEFYELLRRKCELVKTEGLDHLISKINHNYKDGVTSIKIGLNEIVLAYPSEPRLIWVLPNLKIFKALADQLDSSGTFWENF